MEHNFIDRSCCLPPCGAQQSPPTVTLGVGVHLKHQHAILLFSWYGATTALILNVICYMVPMQTKSGRRQTDTDGTELLDCVAQF